MLRTFINDVSGLEMSLAMQYYDRLDSIKQQDHNFSRTEKKVRLQETHEWFLGFSITRDSNIFSIRSDSYILAGNILSTPTWNLFWKLTFNLELVK